MSNYWIFVAAPFKSKSEHCTAEKIYEQRMSDGFWGLGERTSNRKHLRHGDKIVFYLARPISAFTGTATLSSDSMTLSEKLKDQYAHGGEIFSSEYGVMLDDIKRWDTRRAVVDLAAELDFIEDPARWYLYLQGGVRQISENDYNRIVIESLPAKSEEMDSELTSLFALERHLEEFIDHNWESVKWDRDLNLYQEEEQHGRQFPAGKWNIDFLAVDKSSNDLVVIELKRGRTSDTTIGQILRYIRWVKENIAAADQSVKGIIVAKDVDDSLRYAVREVPHVALMTYEVTFSLKNVT